MAGLTVISVAFPFATVTRDPVGGAEQVLAHLDRALVAQGHRSIVIAAEGSTPAGELVAVRQPRGPIGVDDWRRAHDFLRAELPSLAVRSKADLIHMHGIDFADYLPPPGAPVLATLHLPLDCYRQGDLRPRRERTFFNGVSRHQFARTSSVTELVAAIENGVEVPPASSARKSSFVLAMGRICPEKGFHLALDAAKAAGVPMVLAGQVFSYPEHRRYFDEAIRPRLDRSRRWIGPVSGRHKWRLLQRARCLLAPSLVAETASLVAREALAAGTPVIAFPSGALADIVESGRTGFLVHDCGAMAGAIAAVPSIDPATCRQIARERFSVKRMVREYFDLYAHLCRAAA